VATNLARSVSRESVAGYTLLNMPTNLSRGSQSGRWRNLRLIAVGVSVGMAVTLGLLIWASASSQSLQQKDNFLYYFLRSTYRVGDFFHVPSRVSVSTEMVKREFWSPWLRLSLELTWILTAILVAIIVYAVTKFVSRERDGRWLTAITWFALPLGYVAATISTRNWDWGNLWAQPPQPLLSTRGWMLIAELAIFLALSALPSARNPRLSRTWQTVVFVVHFCFWDYLFLHAYPIVRNILTMQYVAVVLAPIAALLAIYSDRRLGCEAPPLPHKRSSLGGAIAAAVAAFALYAIWAPLPRGALGRAMDENDVAVQLSRGPCYGSCPSYAVTIDRDGRVKYVGRRRDGTDDVEYGKITPQQYAEIIALLRDVKFESLEDRAFIWAFDTPSVAVVVASHKADKTVVSDSSYFGPESGPQAKFVSAAASIENIVDTSRWRETTAQSWRR
jgi:hypothetical protein